MLSKQSSQCLPFINDIMCCRCSAGFLRYFIPRGLSNDRNNGSALFKLIVEHVASLRINLLSVDFISFGLIFLSIKQFAISSSPL